MGRASDIDHTRAGSISDALAPARGQPAQGRSYGSCFGRAQCRTRYVGLVASIRLLPLRLGADGWRALEDIARKRGLTQAEAARQAIAETAERERGRSRLAAEVAQLANDPVDRAERNRVLGEMDALAAESPE